MNPYRTLDDIIGRFLISTSRRIYDKTCLNDRLIDLHDNQELSWIYSNCAKLCLFGGGLFSTFNGSNWETALGFSGYVLNSADVVSSFGYMCEKEKVRDPEGYRKFSEEMEMGFQKDWLLRNGGKIVSKTTFFFESISGAYNNIQQKVRMPIFLSSIYYGGRIVDGVYNFFFEDGHKLSELPDLYELFMASGLASWSSAIYLKGSDKEKD